MKKIFILLALASIANNSYCSSSGSAKDIGFIFAHGVGGNKEQVNWYCTGNPLNWFIIGDKNYTMDFPEVVNAKIDNKRICLAQEADINTLKTAHSNFNLKNKDMSSVLVGVSRGASTIINYASTNPGNIKALVLEAPFDTIENVVRNLVERYGLDWVPGIDYISNGIKDMMYPAYDSKSIKPIDRVSHISKDIPVLFIHSKIDKLMPLRSSVELAKKLRDAGHKDVYLLILSTGQHSNYQFCPSAFKYMAVVHAFYKRYGIPYDEAYAAEGDIYLDGCRLK